MLALGSMVALAEAAAQILDKAGLSTGVVNSRFVKPLDGQLLEDLSKKDMLFVTIEEGVIEGGFGSAVLEFFERENITSRVKRIGLPSAFIEHGKREELFRRYNLTPEGIASVVMESFKEAHHG
jgi:1-deoxy-D-xylulose-5-phosphate synthase